MAEFPPKDTAIKRDLTVKSVSLFQPKDIFVLSGEAPGDKRIVRKLSPHETAYTIGDFSYIVWTEGPQKGKVYRVVEKPTDEQLQGLKPFDEFRKGVVNKLGEIEDIAAAGYAADKPYPYLPAKEATKKVGEIGFDFYNAYYGDGETVGLETAQLFDLDGEGEKYYDFLSEIIPPTGWGYQSYLRKLAAESGYTYIGDPDKYIIFEPSTPPGDGLIDSHFRLRGKFFTSSPMYTHETDSTTFSNILQLRGLAPRDYFKSQGIIQLRGGENGKGGSYTPNCLSFWYHDKQTSTNFGYNLKTSSFQYPIIFGMDVEHAEGLQFEGGSMGHLGERVLRDFTPLSRYSHVFVPEFKVEEVKSILESHGFSGMNVIPIRKSE